MITLSSYIYPILVIFSIIPLLIFQNILIKHTLSILTSSIIFFTFSCLIQHLYPINYQIYCLTFYLQSITSTYIIIYSIFSLLKLIPSSYLHYKPYIVTTMLLITIQLPQIISWYYYIYYH